MAPAVPHFMVDCLTDDRTRTVAELRHAFTECGGQLGADGSVAYLFNQVGYMSYAPGTNLDHLMAVALQAGAEDVLANEDGSLEVLTDPMDFLTVRAQLEADCFPPALSEITERASTTAAACRRGGPVHGAPCRPSRRPGRRPERVLECRDTERGPGARLTRAPRRQRSPRSYGSPRWRMSASSGSTPDRGARGMASSNAPVRTAHRWHTAALLRIAARWRSAFADLRGRAQLSTYQPNEIAIERVFVNRNVDSALKLGQARGAALCAVPMATAGVRVRAAGHQAPAGGFWRCRQNAGGAHDSRPAQREGAAVSGCLRCSRRCRVPRASRRSAGSHAVAAPVVTVRAGVPGRAR